MRYFFLPVFFIMIIFPSCEFSVSAGKEKKEINNSKIRNGIVVKANGIKVEQAFLLFTDGTLVPEDNMVKVNQKVVLRLITSGWKEKQGKVFLSGGETVETSEGDILLDEGDLFKSLKDGFSPEDAKYINLNVVITEITKLFDYYKVSFHVKDNTNPDNRVEGYYKLYIK